MIESSDVRDKRREALFSETISKISIAFIRLHKILSMVFDWASASLQYEEKYHPFLCDSCCIAGHHQPGCSDSLPAPVLVDVDGIALPFCKA